MIIMTLRSARNNPLMIEGAGGAEVPKALFYDIIFLREVDFPLLVVVIIKRR